MFPEGKSSSGVCVGGAVTPRVWLKAAEGRRVNDLFSGNALTFVCVYFYLGKQASLSAVSADKEKWFLKMKANSFRHVRTQHIPVIVFVSSEWPRHVSAVQRTV